MSKVKRFVVVAFVFAAPMTLGSCAGLVEEQPLDGGAGDGGGSSIDAGAQDAGDERDGGDDGDAGVSRDGGAGDASVAHDAGQSRDGGASSDAGSTPDGGATDAGLPLDAGTSTACEAQGSARCYYATPTGSGDCSLARPCALTTAFAQLSAGDFLYLRAGTYTPTQSLFTPRAGTASAPITMSGYGDETALVSTHGLGSVIYVEHPYWTIRRLSFEAYDMPDHDRAIITFGENNDAHHGVVTHCRLNLVSSAGHDNVSTIRLQGNRSNDARITDNDLQGFVGALYGANGVQYLGGGNVGSKILHNLIHDVALGIYVKHANADTADTGAEIAFNTMRDCNGGLYGNPTFIQFHDNLMVRCHINLGDNGGRAQGAFDTIEHNTLVDSRVELQNPSEGPVHDCIFRNNVFTQQVRLSPYGSGNLAPHDSSLDYNLYAAGTSALLEYGTTYSLETWRTHTSGDAHSQAGAPVFAGGATPTTSLGFALANGSPGKRQAQDGGDLGAEVSRVPNLQ